MAIRRPAASRAPACLPRVVPLARKALTSRMVFRAYGVAKSGRRSVKMRRAQARLRQKNFRAISWMWTARVPQGRSVKRRW
jgi:hypothetical protein